MYITAFSVLLLHPAICHVVTDITQPNESKYKLCLCPYDACAFVMWVSIVPAISVPAHALPKILNTVFMIRREIANLITNQAQHTKSTGT